MIALAIGKTEPKYEYLQAGGVSFSLTALLVGLLIGGLLACIITVFYNRGVLRFIKTLTAMRADSREHSRTLSELGIRITPSLRHALRARSSLIRKLVSVVLPDGTVLEPIASRDDLVAEKEAESSAIHADREESAGSGVTDASTAEETSKTAGMTEDPVVPDATATVFDPTTATYFLDDRHRRRAEVRFDKRGNDMRVLIPTIIAFVALIATLPVYFPYVVEALDALLVSILGG